MGAGAGKEAAGATAVAPVTAARPVSPATADVTLKSPRVMTNSFIGKAAMDADELLGDKDSNARYVKHELIGKGAFGEAYIVEHRDSRKHFVAKVMDLRQMSPKDKRYAQTEILCLAHSRHFAIIQYVEHCVVDEDTVVIVMEYADRGDLYNNIKKGNLQLSEREAAMYFVQLLLALDHIHRRRMIHRDIKSANVFMTSRALLKLGDFGFSQQYDQTVSNPIATTFLGTPYYLAPEMWRGNRYGKKADMWAAGIVLFELLTTKRPFIAQNMVTLKEKVLNGAFQIPDTVSKEMSELVRAILMQDPNRRLSAQQALRTPIMQHYLVLLEKHVSDSDLDAETKALVAENINDSQEAIKHWLTEEEAQGTTVHHEGVVYKESDGGWKQRYLILGDGFLTLTLAKGKEAAQGSDRSKKIPLDSIQSALPVGSDGGSNNNRWVFAISTTTSSAILMASATQEERDEWVTKLLSALQMS